MTPKILIIDDDLADRALIKQHLLKLEPSFTFLEAGNGLLALELIAAHPDIDCMFIDYELPDYTGLDILKTVYDANKDLGPFPAIMLTEQSSKTLAIEAIRCGAQDYLVKESLSPDMVHIARAKAREMFDLKAKHYNSKTIIEHAQRMDTVGQLSSGIAHDFNNLLTITFGNIRFLKHNLSSRTPPDFEQCLEKIDIIEHATKRGASLIKQLMIFSRQRELEANTIDINRMLHSLSELLERTLGDHIDIQTSLAPDLAYIDVDPGQLEHAIINLCINARDAMVDGGMLSIATDAMHLDEDHTLFQRLSLPAGDYICMTITDTGDGMSDVVQAKIFEPFFTTKDIDKGTGLGLSTVYGFVKESGGAITVDSQQGRGSVFSLYFPVSKSSAVCADNTDDAFVEPPRGDECILLVEDEEEIRYLARVLLEEAGYHVLEACNGQEALQVMQTHPDAQRVKLLFTDIAMPGEMNGVQTAARVQVLKSDVKLLFTSGYAAGALPDMHLMARYPVINKPYDPDDLLFTIRRVLDDEAQL